MTETNVLIDVYHGIYCIYQILEYSDDAYSETLSCSACDHVSV